VSTLSMVVPGVGETMERSSPAMRVSLEPERERED
jgi:hypothetical protein